MTIRLKGMHRLPLVTLIVILSASTPAAADSIFGTPGPTLFFTEGAFGLTTVATFTDDDPSLTAAAFAANIDWGDGTSSSGTIISNGPGFDVSGSHTYADEGNFTPQINLSSTGGGSQSVSDVATVLDAVLGNGSLSPLNSTEGASFSGILGSFQDANTNASPSDFAATIDWGDGTQSSGTVSPNGSGQFTIAGNHTYADEGSYTLTATVNDIGGSTLQFQGSATVADAALSGSGTVFSAFVGVPYGGSTGTFGDGNPLAPISDFAATIDWGDGTPTSTGTIVASGGLFQVFGPHTYTVPGLYTVSTQTEDIGGSSATLTGSADVTTPAAVPEPATWFLAAAGLVVMVTRKWRASRQ